jgi:hypothetical protein
MAGVEIKFKEEEEEEDDDEFTRNDKVVSIVNLLNKYKIKLWEMPNLEIVDVNLKIEAIMSSFEVNLLNMLFISIIIYKINRN